MKKLLAAGLIALTGCSDHVIFNSPYGQARFYQDKLACFREANATIGGYFAVGAPIMVAAAVQANNNQKLEYTKECMEGKGYTILKEWRGPNNS